MCKQSIPSHLGIENFGPMDKEMNMEVVHMEVDIGKDEEMDMEVKIQRNLGNTRSVRSARAQSGWWWVR